jgi:hypothetical protein
MDGTDVARRRSWSRQEAEAKARADALRRQKHAVPTATAAECLRVGQEPEKRLEPLRRREASKER